MPFQPVILWTDALVFLLVAVIVVSGLVHPRAASTCARRGARWRAAATACARWWCSACSSRSVCSTRCTIGRAWTRARRDGKANYAVEVRSVFDVLVDPLGKRPERTYSAPLAAYAYAKETIERPDGTQAREFPRLKFGGAHLKDPANELGHDVLRRTVGAHRLGRGRCGSCSPC